VKPLRGAGRATTLTDGCEPKCRPSEDYAIWRSRDVLGTLAEELRTVIGRAAKCIRIGEDYLGGVVEYYERRIVRWWEEKWREVE